jgi:hypothetical protein
MKIHALAALLLATSLPALALSQKCTFDQKVVASELQLMARRHPGYRMVAGGSAVEWAQRSGYTVRLSYGGCEDLGAEILVRGEKGERGPGMQELIAAVSRYWSPAQARDLESALASGKLTRVVDGDTTFLEASGSVSSAFPLGFTIGFSKHEVSLSWPVA